MLPDLRRRIGAFSVALLLATAGMSAPRATVVAPAGFFPNLEIYLESLRVQAGIPGMSAAVVQDGEIVWERGVGFQNVAARVRAHARHALHGWRGRRHPHERAAAPVHGGA